MNGKMPSSNQAGVYSATLAYLKAVAAIGSDDGRAAVAQMKKQGATDRLFGDLSIRADGRVIHPIHLFEVKTPAESKGTWDLYKQVATVPTDQAFRPISDGGCPMLK